VPEGKERRKSQSFILDPNGNLNGSPENGENKTDKPTQMPFKSQTQQGPNGQIHSIELTLPSQFIPGSVGAFVYLSGNLLGPFINTTTEGGLEKLIRMPTGSGENVMIYLAPNVYVLEYLSKTKQLTRANEQKAYRFIQYGYARELNYRRSDKSFSAFGNSRPGSTWFANIYFLTAT